MNRNDSADTHEADEDQTAFDFAGKIVTFYLGGAEYDSSQIVLKNIKMVELGGRQMIIGIGADTGHDANWTSGLSIGFAWDSVQSFYGMTPEQFKQTRARQR